MHGPRLSAATTCPRRASTNRRGWRSSFDHPSAGAGDRQRTVRRSSCRQHRRDAAPHRWRPPRVDAIDEHHRIHGDRELPHRPPPSRQDRPRSRRHSHARTSAGATPSRTRTRFTPPTTTSTTLEFEPAVSCLSGDSSVVADRHGTKFYQLWPLLLRPDCDKYPPNYGDDARAAIRQTSAAQPSSEPASHETGVETRQRRG